MKHILAGFCMLLSTGGILVYPQEAATENALMILEDRGEVILEFEHPGPQMLNWLSKWISIDRVDRETVKAYANREGFERFLELDVPYRVLDWPGKNIKRTRKGYLPVTSWQVYPTYEQYDSLMVAFQENHPQRCRLDTIGYSQEGRALLVVKISDHVEMDEAEPEFFYTSSMHGDELGGYVLMLRLIDYLLNQYGIDPQATRLVDSVEIWINPLANPDGAYHDGNHTIAGATRFNANGVDLNRNFPDPVAGPHPDGQDHQPETTAMMEFMQGRHFSMSANFHGGEEVVNYPWDTWQKRHADDAWFQFISHEYADTAQAYSVNYMNGFNDGITNGYDWYSITGGRQDYTTYFLNGRETTIELDVSKITPEAELDQLWNYNYRSFINYMAQVLYGIHGSVTDADNETQAVPAMVTIVGYDLDNSMVYSDSIHGFYARLLNEGTYDLTFSADGYFDQTVSGVAVSNYRTTRLDIALVKNTSAVSGPSEAPFQLSIFPNPARGYANLTLELETEATVALHIIDLNGRIVFQTAPEKFGVGTIEKSLELDFLEPGSYIIQLEVNGQMLRNRLIKL